MFKTIVVAASLTGASALNMRGPEKPTPDAVAAGPVTAVDEGFRRERGHGDYVSTISEGATEAKTESALMSAYKHAEDAGACVGSHICPGHPCQDTKAACYDLFMGVMNPDGTHNYAATKSAVEFAAEREITHIDPDEAWKETEEEMIAADHAALEHADELIAAADKEHEKPMKELKQKEEKQLAADEKDRDAYQAKHDAITAEDKAKHEAEEAQRKADEMKALSLSSALTAFENAGGKKEDFAKAIMNGARERKDEMKAAKALANGKNKADPTDAELRADTEATKEMKAADAAAIKATKEMEKMHTEAMNKAEDWEDAAGDKMIILDEVIAAAHKAGEEPFAVTQSARKATSEDAKAALNAQEVARENEMAASLELFGLQNDKRQAKDEKKLKALDDAMKKADEAMRLAHEAGEKATDELMQAGTEVEAAVMELSQHDACHLDGMSLQDRVECYKSLKMVQHENKKGVLVSDYQRAVANLLAEQARDELATMDDWMPTKIELATKKADEKQLAADKLAIKFADKAATKKQEANNDPQFEKALKVAEEHRLEADKHMEEMDQNVHDERHATIKIEEQADAIMKAGDAAAKMDPSAATAEFEKLKKQYEEIADQKMKDVHLALHEADAEQDKADTAAVQAAAAVVVAAKAAGEEKFAVDEQARQEAEELMQTADLEADPIDDEHAKLIDMQLKTDMAPTDQMQADQKVIDVKDVELLKMKSAHDADVLNAASAITSTSDHFINDMGGTNMMGAMAPDAMGAMDDGKMDDMPGMDADKME